jgi:hypothetical protein
MAAAAGIDVTAVPEATNSPEPIERNRASRSTMALLRNPRRKAP